MDRVIVLGLRGAERECWISGWGAPRDIFSWDLLRLADQNSIILPVIVITGNSESL